MNPQNTKLTNEKIDYIINAFILKRLPELYAHLVDSDENDGEELRQSIKSLTHQAEIKARIDEVELAWHNNRIVLFDYQKRLSELIEQKDLLTKESK